MKTFKMYVKTVIYNEQNKILLLKEKREDNQPHWDLPGSTFTEEQSFDETVIANVQKQIGYYVYPGQIIGISDYTNRTEKEVHVIMEGNILNGELLLSKEYENYAWVKLNRIKDYPLVPWLAEYMQNNKNPFEDVETEINELTEQTQRRRDIIQEDLRNSFRSNEEKEEPEEDNKNRKSSFGLLKDTIIRTFHPKEAQVTRTTPKPKEIYEEPKNEEENHDSIADKFNFRINRKDEEDEAISDIILKSSDDDIIIEHNQEDIVKEEDIIIEHENIEDTDTISSNDIVPEDIIIKADEINNIEEPISEKYDMNVNRQENMKSVEPVRKEPEIKIIHKDDETPLIRTEKASKERISFNSENIKRSGWKDRLNKLNRTDANDEKKEIPRPKGKRR